MIPLISVIIPVFNVDKYLVRCIESIINQTYKNLEIILINDGSIDNSGYICNKYKKMDNRIRYINKKNEGVSVARNIGIDICIGELLTFIDSDDWIDKNMIERLYNNLVDYNADISCCNYYLAYKKKNKPQWLMNDNKLELNVNEAIIALLLGKCIGMSSCNKLYKKELFSDLRFNTQLICGEDMLLVISAMMKSKKVVYDSATFYYYRQRLSSKMHELFNDKKIQDEIKVNEYIIIKLKHKYADASKFAMNRLLTIKLRIISELLLDKDYRELSIYKFIYYEMHNNIKKYLFCCEYSKKNKLALCLLYFNKHVFHYIANLKRKDDKYELYG